MENIENVENITKIVNEFGESIVQVTGDIPVNLPAQAGERFLFISHAQRFLTHALHKRVYAVYGNFRCCHRNSSDK